MDSMIPAVLMIFLSGIAAADDSDRAIGNETLTADQAQDKADTAKAAEAKKPEVFTPPPGYRARKRGDSTVYCIKDKTKAKVTGTRFPTETCYEEAQLRDFIIAQ